MSLAVLGEALARIESALDALEDGNSLAAAAVLLDLKDDLVAELLRRRAA